MLTCPVYVFYLVHHEPERRREHLQGFVDAYYDIDPGWSRHGVVIIDRIEAAANVINTALADLLPWRRVMVDAAGLDIGAYRDAVQEGVFGAVRVESDPILFFMNSYARPRKKDWLGNMVEALSVDKVALVGATGSWESPSTSDGAVGFPSFPNPHIRTNAFGMRLSTFRRLQFGSVVSKASAHHLECGERSLTNQVLDMGLRAVVVDVNGFEDVSTPASRVFRMPQQQDRLLVSDNRTEAYAMASPDLKARFEQRAWGERFTEPPPVAAPFFVGDQYAGVMRQVGVGSPAREEAIVDAFHKVYYDERRCFHELTWMGVPMQKYPNDLLVYQEIIFRCRPDVILETGTNNGASAHFFATMLELCDRNTQRFSRRECRVVTVDIFPLPKPLLETRQDICYVQNISSTTPRALQVMTESCLGAQTMVVLDSDHAEAHVFRELELYAPLVSVGQYLIVEDTNVNGNPVNLAHGPGPKEAVARFLATELGACFEVDRGCEKLLLTANPGGYLRRIR